MQGLRRGRHGVVQAIAGGMMVRRGVTGKCEIYQALGVRTAPSDSVIPYELGVRARASITVQHPRQSVYKFWRQFGNLPRFMQHLVSVQVKDEIHSHWIAEGPAGARYEWDSEIINEIPGELLAWKSLPGSDLVSTGSVHFRDAPGDRGTEIRVELQYNPPAGAIGALVARLLGREPEQEIQSDLRRLKQFLEAGELATTDGQSHGPTTRTSNVVTKGLEEVLA